MKKLIVIIIFLSIIFVPGVTFNKNVYGSNYTYTIKDEQIYNYTYEILPRISTNIEFLGLQAFNGKIHNNNKVIESTLKNIDSQISEINYLIDEIQTHYEDNVDNIHISNIYLVLSTIVSEYRVTLTQLKEFVQSDDSDYEFKSLAAYFVSFSEASRKLNDLKLEVSK